MTHPSTDAILQFFDYEHLPEALREVSQPFYMLAHCLISPAADRGFALEGPEATTALRKLLEAKDCAVRAALVRPGHEGG